MKKIVFCGVFIVLVFIAAFAIKLSLNVNSENFSDVTLANIEALAKPELVDVIAVDGMSICCDDKESTLACFLLCNHCKMPFFNFNFGNPYGLVGKCDGCEEVHSYVCNAK